MSRPQSPSLNPQSQSSIPKSKAWIAKDSNALARWLVRWRWIAFVLGMISFGPLWWAQSGLKMNRELSAMFADDDAVLLDYQNLQSTFGGHLVVMLVYDDEELFTPDGVRRNRQWSNRLEAIDGVAEVLSVAKLVDVFGYLRPSLPFMKASDPALLSKDDAVAEQFRELFEGYTHGADESTASIVAMIEPDLATAAVRSMRAVAREMGPQAVLVGEPILLEDAFDLILADGRRLAIGTISLLCLVIVFALRDFRIVVLSAVAITWSTITTRAVMLAMGIEMSLVSTILIAIISVIVVASVLHLGVRMSDGKHGTLDVISGLAIPITITCLTDAAGFAALMVSEVRPVMQFGVMTAVAALLVLVSIAIFAPLTLSMPDWWSRARQRGESADAHETSFGKRFKLRLIATWSVGHRRLLGAIALIGFLVGCVYVSRLSTNTSFLQNFREDSEIVEAYTRIEERLGGAGVMDVMLPVPDSLTVEYLDRVRGLEERLRLIRVGKDKQVALTKVLSLADADAVAAQVTMLSFVSPDIRLAGMRSAIPTFAEALLTFPDPRIARDSRFADDQQRWLRIMLRTNEDLSGPDKSALSNAVREEVLNGSWEPESASSRPAVTGYSILMSNLVASLVRDQWWALAAALIAVGGILWSVARSLREVFAALVVNTLPILLVLSCTGVMGGELDLGSAMIGAVSIGLSIDGSVHFLAGYHRRLGQGLLRAEAAIDSAADLGVPILLASLALVVGFAVLITSPFVPTSTFGLLVAITLAVSSVANLTLLPALVVSFAPKAQ